MSTRSRGPGAGTRFRTGLPADPSRRSVDARDADAEFLEGAWDEAGPATLDFDDEASSRDLHEREPEDDFAALDARPVMRDAADLADLASLIDDDDSAYDDDDAYLH